jgi:hypothetical protein
LIQTELVVPYVANLRARRGPVGYEVTKDVVHRLADGVDPDVITTAEAAAGSMPGVIHAHPRARWTGHTLRAEIEGWADPELPGTDAGAIGRLVAGQITPEAAPGKAAGRRVVLAGRNCRLTRSAFSLDDETAALGRTRGYGGSWLTRA